MIPNHWQIWINRAICGSVTATKVCSNRDDTIVLVVESKDESKALDTNSIIFYYKPAFFKVGLYLVNFIKSKVDMPYHKFLD